MPFDPIPTILDQLRSGRMIVLVDDEHRENEGDLVCAAEMITPETVNFMTKRARGVLCVALDSAICDALDLGPQSSQNTAQLGTALTVTVDAQPRFGVSTGVSVDDRTTTIRLLADPQTRPVDLARPGHVNPIRARDGGVLVRTGQTEGSVDLCRLAGLRPAATIIEIMNDDGSMARLPQLEQLCAETGMKMCSVADIVAWRMGREKLVERIEEVDIETEHGPFRLIAYRSRVDPLPHIALCKGRVGVEPEIAEPVLARVHAQNLLGDVFGDRSMPTGRSLAASLRLVREAGEGVVVYMRQDAMGAGLVKQLQTRRVAGDEPVTAPRAEMSTNIGIGSQILRDLGIRRLNLISSHQQHYHALEGFGLSVDAYITLGEDDDDQS